jgi:hypothetical protein
MLASGREPAPGEREQLISELTGKLRASLDMETVLTTAAEQIGQRLGMAQVEIQLSQDVERITVKEISLDNNPTNIETLPQMIDGKVGGNGRIKHSSEDSSGQRSADATE